MAEDKAAFGVFPQMKPRRSRQDPEAAKNVPVDLARGFVAGTLGMPADILNLPGALTTAITGKPTYEIPFGSEDIERRLPFRSDTPVSRAATGAGQLAGGFYTGPLSGARAAMAIPKAVVQAGKDFVMAAPSGAPRMFIGPKAKTWDQAKADEAARMEKAGVDPVDIWRQTGTFRGADGIQRQEISDRSAKFLSADERQERIAATKSKIAEMQEKIKPTPQKDLFPKALTEAKREVRDDISILKGDVKGRQKNPRTQGLLAQHIFEHPELYKAYPELQNVNIVTQVGGGNTLGALNIVPSRGFYPGSMEIDIYPRAFMTNPESTALHEMQHAVQTLEGMSPGGNITMAFQDPKAFEVLEEVRKRALTPMTFEEYAAKLSHIDPSELVKSYDKYVASIPEMVKKMDRELQSQAALEYYKRLAGEAEARATQFRRDMTPQQRAEEYPYSSYDVPEESLITKPPKEFAEGGEVSGGAAFGVFPQMKPRRGAQDREASKNVPIDLARGFVAGTLGMPGDIESLVRLPYELVTGKESPTILPTSSDIEKRLPLKSDTPVSRAATGAGQLAGGFYTGPLSGARAATAVPKALVRAGRDFIEAAGQPAVNVVKPKGGNWLTDRVGRELQYLKSPTVAGQTPAQRIPLHKDLLEDPFLSPESRATIERHLDEEIKRNAVDQWVDRNLSNYIKNQMATPEDPVRLMLDRRTEEIEGKFAKDMERANRIAERAAAEADPRRAGNLTREADRLKMEAQADRDLSMSHILPNQQELAGTANRVAGEARLSRAIEGFPEEGVARTPAGKTWENITDSEMGVSANRAGDAQAAVEKAQKTEDVLAELKAKGQEVNNAFVEKLKATGRFTDNQIDALSRSSPTDLKLNSIDSELREEYELLSKKAQALRQSYKEKDLKIAEQYPWVEKLDPETRLYEFYGSHDLGFSHIIDVLKQDLAAGRITPEQLNRMSMDQAVRRAADYDRELAANMNATRAAAREGLPVYKEYPEGYRWVELNKPGAFAAESEAMGHSVRGYEPPKGHPDWSPGSGEEGSSGYGFGGWEGIKSGRAKIYSLVDPKGEPHVTVEVRGLGDIAKKRIQEQYTTSGQKVYVVGANDAGEGGEVFTDLADAIKHEAEFIEKYQKHLRPEITQIRGKQNTPPKEEYLPYVQDLVKSGDWSNVGDLQNTGLFQIDPASELAKSLISRGIEVPKFVAPDEMTGLLKQAEVGSYANPSRGETYINPAHPDWADDGMKRGGRVSISDNPDAQMMDVLDKKMAGGGGVYDTEPDMSDGGKIIQGPAFSGGGVAKLAKLVRAMPKSKQEIEAIAERIAPQVTGEFVREAKGTKSVAGKTQKQFAREKELPVEFTDIQQGKPAQVLSPEKLQGMVVTGIPGDPTVTGRSLVRVGDIKLDSPSPQHGGPLYGQYQPEDIFWASGLDAAGGVQRVAKEAQQAYDAPVVGQYIMMGPDSINYAQHFADANLSAIDLSKMTKKQIEQFNKLVRFGDEKSGPRPSFPGIENKEDAYLHLAFDPHLRRHFNKLMQMPTVTERFNLPSGQDIRFAVTEPALRDLETGVTGFSMGRLQPEVPKSALPRSTHPTYSHDIPGEFMGGLKYPTPYELTFPDTLKSVRENPKQVGQEFGSLKMVGPRQIYDQQMIDELMMYEEAMRRLTGKKEGGEVEMGGGGAIKAGLKEMMERIANRFGGFEAQRLERAADEVPNLEKLYQAEALEKLFGGDNAKGIMTMNPADFEKFSTKLPFDPKSKKEFVFEPDFAKNLPPNMTQEEYIRYLANLPGFSDIPFLEINTTPFGQKPAPFISGHEGRHRSRALAESGQPTSIVQVFPRANLRESMPRRTREEYLNALNEELEMTNRMVRPQKTERTEKPRSLIKLPPVYKEGGEINMAGGGNLSKAAAEAMAKFKQLRGEFAERAAEAAKYEKETANIPTRDLMSFEEWKASQKRSESQPLPKETGNKSGGLIKVQKKRKAKA